MSRAKSQPIVADGFKKSDSSFLLKNGIIKNINCSNRKKTDLKEIFVILNKLDLVSQRELKRTEY